MVRHDTAWPSVVVCRYCHYEREAGAGGAATES